jgi:hypothetical protein
VDHVVVRKLEHLTGTQRAPRIGYAVETRDRPGPVFKEGAYQDDAAWIQLHGGLFVAKAKVKIGWVGEYAGVQEVRARTRGAPIHDVADYWAGRARFGYAAVAELESERWIDPFWAGPRTYGYEWVVLENDKKQKSWLTPKEAPRSADDLRARFDRWMADAG